MDKKREDKTIYLVTEDEQAIATASDWIQVRALERVGFKVCTEAEYRSVKENLDDGIQGDDQ